MSAVQIVKSPDHLRTLLSTDLNRVSLINFWAPWAEPCLQMNEVVAELSKKYPQALVLQVCHLLTREYPHAIYYWGFR